MIEYDGSITNGWFFSRGSQRRDPLTGDAHVRFQVAGELAAGAFSSLTPSASEADTTDGDSPNPR